MNKKTNFPPKKVDAFVWELLFRRKKPQYSMELVMEKSYKGSQVRGGDFFFQHEHKKTILETTTDWAEEEESA